MNIQLTLASRYLLGRKLRTALTTLAIVFGVLVIFGMNTILPAFVQAFQANVLAAADQVDATITLKTADAFDEGAATKVSSVKGVRAVSGFIDRAINLPADYFDKDPKTPDLFSAFSIVGLSSTQVKGLHAYPVKSGRFIEDQDDNAVVIGEGLSVALRVNVGDTLTIPTVKGETALKIIGVRPAKTRPGNEELVLSLTTTQHLFDMPKKINVIEANFDTLDEEARASIKGEIITTLGDSFQVGALAGNAEILTNLKVAQGMFGFLGALALLMGGFIIFNTFRTIITERRRDLGMLRTLGANKKTLFGLLITEGLLQGIIGTAIGLGFGYLLGWGGLAAMGPMMQHYMNVSIGAPVVSVGLIVSSVFLGVGVTLLAGLLPAMSAMKVSPLEALRPSLGALSLRRLVGKGFWVGVVLLVMAAVALLSTDSKLISLGSLFFIVGLILIAPALINPIARLFGAMIAKIFARDGTSQLAEGNLSRQPSRAAVTASTTMIGMAILVMAASVLSSVEIGFGRVLEKSLGSDYLLVPPAIALWGGDVGASTSLAESLRAKPEVQVVSTLRFAPTRANNIATSLLGISPQDYPQVSGLTFVEGDESAYQKLSTGRNAIINGVMATNAKLNVGDELELSSPTGPQRYKVVAVAIDYLNAKIATGYISQENLKTDFLRAEDVLLQVNLKRGADPKAAEVVLHEVVRAYPQFRLISGREYIQENLKIFEAVFAGLFMMVLFLALPSLIAMLNTLAIGVIERTREIGMLRAVGATRRQVRRVIVLEALILASIGTAFGVVSGLYLGYMAVAQMRSSGFPIVYAFPWAGVLLALAAGLFFGALAAIIPARQAARLEVIRALRFD